MYSNDTNHGVLLENRDLSRFPYQELEKALEMPGLFFLQQPVERYLGMQREAGLPEQDRAIVAHALVSYLTILRDKDQTEHAKFLIPNGFNPAEPQHGGVVYTDIWDTDRRSASTMRAQIMKARVDAQGKNDPGISRFETGSMFAGKSEELAAYYEVFSADPRYEVLVYTSQAMEESYIESRCRNIRIPANKYEGNFMYEVQRLGKALTFEPFWDGEKRLVVLIDEVSFMSPTHDNALQLALELHSLSQCGANVFGAGLNMNYRAQEFEVFGVLTRLQRLKEHPVEIQNHLAQSGYYVIDHIPKIMEATHTWRIDVNAGFADMLLPVVIPRSYANICTYFATPKEAHLFAVLRKYDPEIVSRLDAITARFEEQRHCPLLDYYGAIQ